MEKAYELHEGDCLDVMPTLEKGSVDMVFADLPYGVTQCVWDKLIDSSTLNAALERLASPVEVFTCVQPLTSSLVLQRPKLFHQELVWARTSPRGFQTASKRPLRAHENILIFRRCSGTYNPQKVTAARKTVHTPYARSSQLYGISGEAQPRRSYTDRFPTSVVNVSESDLRHDTLNGHVSKRLHPTQKPVALLEWLIATYTNPGDTVLDPTFGSGTTGVACARLGRKFIGIEKDGEYFHRGSLRIEAAYAQAKTQEVA